MRRNPSDGAASRLGLGLRKQRCDLATVSEQDLTVVNLLRRHDRRRHRRRKTLNRGGDCVTKWCSRGPWLS